jgi:glycosyltransferase involved in cell wall biosynthesis
LSEIIQEHCTPISNNLQKISRIRSTLRRIIKTNSLLKEHCKSCAEEIEKEGFDVIFANSCGLTYMPFISLYTKIPVVVYLGEPNRKLYEANEHGNIWELPFFKFSLKGINRVRKDLLRTYSLRLQLSEEIRAARAYDRILVNSLYSRECIKKAYGIDSSVCYLGVDEKVFQIEMDLVKYPYVVGLGRISEAKNVETAIRVIAKVPAEKRPQLKWISNGFAPDYFESMNILAKELNVDFIPMINISDSNLIRVLSEAAVMIYTSYLEPFGLAPLEANVCGTSVVAIAEGGVRESIQSSVNGFLVNGNHPDEMADLIIKFISDVDYAKQMGLQSRIHTLKYWNWSRMAENIERELQAVII